MLRRKEWEHCQNVRLFLVGLFPCLVILTPQEQKCRVERMSGAPCSSFLANSHRLALTSLFQSRPPKPILTWLRVRCESEEMTPAKQRLQWVQWKVLISSSRKSAIIPMATLSSEVQSGWIANDKKSGLGRETLRCFSSGLIKASKRKCLKA